MRLIGKLLALPFVIVTGIFYLFCKFLVVVSGAVLGILSGIVLLAAPPFFYNYGCLLRQLFDWRDFIERYNANLFSFCHLCA